MEVAVPYFDAVDAAPACASFEEQSDEGLIDAMDLIKHQFGIEPAEHAAAESDDVYADPFGTRYIPGCLQYLASINSAHIHYSIFRFMRAICLQGPASSAVSHQARESGSEPFSKSDQLSDKALRKLARREKKQQKRAERKLRKAAKRLAAAQGTSEEANAASGTAQADASFDIDESSSDGGDDEGDQIGEADEADKEHGGDVDPDEEDGEDLMAATSTSGGDGAGDEDLDEEEWFLQQSRNREGADAMTGDGVTSSKAAHAMSRKGVNSKVCISDTLCRLIPLVCFPSTAYCSFRDVC